MWEFLQANGSWIVLGLFFVLMLRMHVGGGHGMGHGGHGAPGDQKDRPDARTRPPARGSKAEDAAAADPNAPNGTRSQSCH